MFDHLVDLTEPICQKLNPHNLDDSYDPYKAAYGSMPTHAAANPAIQQMYINGHFCYAYKFGIVTNGLGIVRDISFYNKDFLTAHPDIIVEKKSVLQEIAVLNWLVYIKESDFSFSHLRCCHPE